MKGVVYTKKLIVIALCLLLTGCQFLPHDDPASFPDRVTTAQTNNVPEVQPNVTEVHPDTTAIRLSNSIDEWEKIFRELPLIGIEVTGGFGKYFCGYDLSVMAGDGSNFCIFDDRGTAVEFNYPDGFEAGAQQGLACADGCLYELRRSYSAQDSIFLVRTDGELNTEIVGEIPYSLDNDDRLRIRPAGDGVIVGRTVETYDYEGGHEAEYTAWLYDPENGLREVIHEKMSEVEGESDTSGVGIFGAGIIGDEIRAVGYGRRDGVLELILLRYSFEGNLLGTKKLADLPEQHYSSSSLYRVADFEAFPIGNGGAVRSGEVFSLYFPGEEVISDLDGYGTLGGRYYMMTSVGEFTTVYDIETGLASSCFNGEFKDVDERIIAADNGFIFDADGKLWFVSNDDIAGLPWEEWDYR